MNNDSSLEIKKKIYICFIEFISLFFMFFKKNNCNYLHVESFLEMNVNNEFIIIYNCTIDV